jgi:hypothetical protein
MSAYTDFRNEAKALGLIVDRNEYPGRMFWLDLNMGQFAVPANAIAIRQLVTVCQKHFPGRSGEHIAILELIAQKSDLANASNDTVPWYRSYHYIDRVRSEWVSLAEWLKSQGV